MAQKQKDGVFAITGMFLVILGVAMVTPAIIISLNSPQDTTLEQNEEERLILSGTLSSTAVDINDGPNAHVNLTLVNERNGEVRTTNELAEGDTETLQFPNGNVTITDIDIIDETTAIIGYEYPTYIGYPDNADVVFKNIGLFIVVLTFIMIVGALIVVSEVMY